MEAISKAVHSIAPEALIIVDGVQYAAHGGINIDQYKIDGYAISPYKMYSRHGYGFAWVSHFFVERNKPATFTYPFFSLLSDYIMFWEILRGKHKIF